jgi:hypothetical protein
MNKGALIENDGFLSKDSILALNDRNIEIGVEIFTQFRYCLLLLLFIIYYFS